MWHNENLHEYQLTPSQIGLCIYQIGLCVYQKCPAWCLDHIKWYRNICSPLLCFLSLLKHFAQKLKYQIKTKARSPLPEVDGGGGGEEGGIGWTHFLQAYWCVHSYVLKEEKKKGFPGGSVINSLPVNAGDAGLIPGPGRLHTSQSN